MKIKTRCGKANAAAVTAVIAFLAFLVLAAGTDVWSQTAQAQDPQTDVRKVTQKVEPGVFVSGQKVAIDPETKKIRQLTPEEAQALSEGLKDYTGKAPGELKIYQYPNGMLAVELPEEFMDTMVVTRNPDGTLSTECVRGIKAGTNKAQTELVNVPDSSRNETKSNVDSKTAGKMTGQSTDNPYFSEKE